MTSISTETMRFFKILQPARFKNMMSSKHSQPDHGSVGLSTTVRGDTLLSVKSADCLGLSQAVPELAAVSTEHSGYTIKLTSEIERDIWLGRKYLEYLLAELLLQHSSKAEQQIVLDKRLEAINDQYAYDECYASLQGTNIRCFDKDTTRQFGESKSFRDVVLGWTGAILRRGTTDENQELRLNLRKHAQIHSISSLSSDSTWPTSADPPKLTEGSTGSTSPLQVHSLFEDNGGVILEQSEGSNKDTVLFPVAEQEIGSCVEDLHSVPLWRFTSILWEYAASLGSVPVYKEKVVSAYPPIFQMSVSLEGSTANAQAKTKKTAKHLASRALCDLMRIDLA